MKRSLIVIGLLIYLFLPQVSWAATPPYPNPYRQTSWNNLTDAVHTFGQNAQQTRATLYRLHKARTKARLISIQKANQAKLKSQTKAWTNSRYAL